LVYFISDLHLGYYDRATEKERQELLLAFLNTLPVSGTTLVIVGDLFDYWFDYKYVIPKDFFRVVTKLMDLKDNGVEIIYLMGNHDFGHYRFFPGELGIEVIPDDFRATFYGKKFYISHGDGKIANDKGYLILKKFLRNSFVQSLFRLVHPDIGIRIASMSSKKSRHYTTRRQMKDFDSLFDFAKKKIDEGFDFVVMGHTHKADFKQYNGGVYVNLGSWLDTPLCGIFDGSNFELVEVEKIIKNK
jgi:UDP-2,3-diacylglucosamine hydrolase